MVVPKLRMVFLFGTEALNGKVCRWNGVQAGEPMAVIFVFSSRDFLHSRRTTPLDAVHDAAKE